MTLPTETAPPAGHISTTPAALKTGPRPAVPEESRLEMPEQSLSRYEKTGRKPKGDAGTWLARLIIFGGALALTCYGGWQMYKVVSVGGTTTLEWALLVLFVANFSWIALAFTSALVGFVWMLFLAPKPPGIPDPLSTRTAIVMPIYNESPERVFAAVEAMVEEVEATGLGRAFEWFFLSDTTNADVFVAEEAAFLKMRERCGPQAQIWYRHRPQNTARKAGNIADFVTRWGGRYDHMLVLDADSLMLGHAMVNLAAAMEADPNAGIIQTLPLIINRNTLFARLQQFAARIYGPVIAAGLSTWMGRDGNYWGHNAIIRTRAFADHCGLPHLKGKPPFGGHVLSHDFVEAAFIRRAGWSVYMLPVLDGSYEESPPTLIDLAARDRRWCQGNLQHTRILPARGLHMASRQHFATGIFAYVASPLWMLQLMVGMILVLQASYIKPEYFTSEFALVPAFPRFDAERSLQLFAITMTVLLMPKVFGLLLSLLQGKTRRGSGGAIRLVISSLFEVVMSALLAPVMMLIQTGHVVHFLFGFDTGWNPQRRDDGSIPFMAIVKRHRSHVIFGVLSLISGLLISPSLVAWMSPTIAGLILAIFLSWATGLLAVGMAFRRVGLLATPEERAKPPVVARAAAILAEVGGAPAEPPCGLRTLYDNPALQTAHRAYLPPRTRQRGDIAPDWALAGAKLDDAETIEDAIAWLKPKERMAVLNDGTLLDTLLKLKRAGDAPQQRAVG
ncbi:Glucans biosynthesis glucosyltransferase H [Beijerinckiaceae bacterium RH AL1]|nr:glucans biosynthesis glucosyltransferase MdoH [Beijerinckiaceae bacterium]VVB45025.1 Glucans biosynthesis glucosyltransferase H [Beijerinckiaceae bacterium RH CH11]VVB45105.1 Glucans biosynthesis glucosyltransferase H [Beijerinckiaceae bacterium RH AL8]VVC54657.1 Glucans biosynthesis glucosyltransferase H [Beijerinckiaceae bacterium RH AL1]